MKMIQVKKSYVLELTESQARELYEILRTARDIGNITPDYEICFVYAELKQIFDSGIR
jgi:hypothetical protein